MKSLQNLTDSFRRCESKLSRRRNQQINHCRALRFEPLEDRRLLAVMPLTVDITRFAQLDNPDDGGAGDYYVEVTIGQNPTERNPVIFHESREISDFATFTRDIDTAAGPVSVVIHVYDYDSIDTGFGEIELPPDEIDINPLLGRRGELVVVVDPRTGTVTNENERPFPGSFLFDGSQTVFDDGTFVSIGRDDPDAGQVEFKILLGTRDVDRDGDGLLDTWEIWGIDASDPSGRANLGRRPDLRLPGANPDHADLYVEVDAMQGVAPQAQALANVVAAFAAVPNSLVRNPDGLPGITLHLEDGAGGGDGLDETTIPRASWIGKATIWTGFDDIKMRHNLAPTDPGGFGTEAERNDEHRAEILAAKALAYRYCIFADRFAANLPFGLAEAGGSSNDFIVTLGGWLVNGGTIDQQAGVFMHELGHTLGLDVGGGDPINWKPNYHSVMNFNWVMPFVAPPDATAEQIAFQNSWKLDYSQSLFNVLTERALDENSGIVGHVGHTVRIGPILDADGNPKAPSFVKELGPVDWNGDGVQNSPPRDVNFLGDRNGDSVINVDDASPGQTLEPYDDWLRLRYKFRDRPGAVDGVHPAGDFMGMTLREFIAFSDVTAPASTLTIGDPQYPAGGAQPFVTSATAFSISATDAGSGVHSVSYRVFPQGSTPPAFTRTMGASAQFTIAGADGTYQVETFATDKAGNVEATHVQLISLDNTAPVITIFQPAATEYVHSAILTLNYVISDGAGSGVGFFAPTLDGATTVAGHGLQSGQAIHLLTELPVGTHTFAIAASDNVQNISNASVTFEVIVTPESIKEDVRYFLSVGSLKNKGMANSLLAKLNSAARAIERDQCPTAINIYNAFIHELNAQSGKGVDATAAAIMIADAEYLISHCERFVPVAPLGQAASVGLPPASKRDTAPVRRLAERLASDSAAQRTTRIETGVDVVFLRMGESVFDDRDEDVLGGGGSDGSFFDIEEALDFHSKFDLLTVARSKTRLNSK